jgi:prefoldin alpha subunit
MRKEEVIRNLSLMEYYKQQLESISAQTQYLQAALLDYHKAKMTIEGLKDAGETKILIPVGGGAFIDGFVKGASKVLIDIGAGVVTEKTFEEAVKKIDEKIKRLEGNYERALSMTEKLQNELADLYQKTQKLVEEKKENV